MLKPTALLLFLCFAFPAFSQQAPESWRFAVSGDSRNCGDVVMPAIAQSVHDHHARFYWHMGDFRAMYGVDEDIQKRYDGKLPMDEYLRNLPTGAIRQNCALAGWRKALRIPL